MAIHPDAAGKATLDLQALPPARGDRSVIRQVLIHLLSNALKFTRYDGPVWADGEKGEGTTVYFSLPNPDATDDE